MAAARRCGCGAATVWVRSTEFSGDHPYCQAYAQGGRPMDDEQDDPADGDHFSEHERHALLLALAQGMAERGGFTEEDAAAMMDWADSARVNANLLVLALAGRLDLAVGPDGVTFGARGVWTQ